MFQLSTAKAQKRNQGRLLSHPQPRSLPSTLVQEMDFPELLQKPQHHDQFLSFLRIMSLFIAGMCLSEGFLLVAAGFIWVFYCIFFSMGKISSVAADVVS